ARAARIPGVAAAAGNESNHRTHRRAPRPNLHDARPPQNFSGSTQVLTTAAPATALRTRAPLRALRARTLGAHTHRTPAPKGCASPGLVVEKEQHERRAPAQQCLLHVATRRCNLCDTRLARRFRRPLKRRWLRSRGAWASRYSGMLPCFFAGFRSRL